MLLAADALLRAPATAPPVPGRPPRTLGRRLLSAGIGGALIVGAAWLLAQLNPDRPPERYPVIAVIPPTQSDPGTAFTSSLHVEFDGCGEPIQGTFATGGSQEYWAARGESTEPADETFLVSLPGAIRVKDVTLADDPDVLAYPTLQRSDREGSTPQTLLPERDYRVRSLWPGEDDERTLIAGRVADWRGHATPLVISFSAQWADAGRDLTSCYLQLPSLAGEDTASEAYLVAGECGDDVQRHELPPAESSDADLFVRVYCKDNTYREVRPYRRSVDLTIGSTSVDPGRGQLVSDDSRPAPDDSVSGLPMWTCAPAPYNTSRSSPRDGRQPPNEQFLSAPVSDCRAEAVIEDVHWWQDRDFLLVIAGALVGLGAALLIESLVVPLLKT